MSNMERGEMSDTLESAFEALFEHFGETLPPPPPPPLPPPLPTAPSWPKPHFHPQLPRPLSEGYFQPWHVSERKNPLTYYPEVNWNRNPYPVVHHKAVNDPDLMQPCYLCRQPEQQHLNIQPPVNYFPTYGAESYPSPLSYPRLQNGGVSAFSPYVGISKEPPSVKHHLKKKPEQSQENRVKKPLNPFMLFMKEQRAKGLAERDFKDSATFAQAMGKMWGSMSKEQKDRYYQQSYEERLRHALQHPNWSASDNYGRKWKRIRIRSATKTGGFASKPEELPQQANNPGVAPVQSAVTEAYTSHTDTQMSLHTNNTEGAAPNTLL